MGLFSRRKDDPSEDVAPLDGVGEGELIDAEADDDTVTVLRNHVASQIGPIASSTSFHWRSPRCRSTSRC